MDNQGTIEKKSAKKQLIETVHTKLDSTLAEFKALIGEKKYSGYLKKASKGLAVEISKETKKAKERQKKLVQKAAKKEKIKVK